MNISKELLKYVSVSDADIEKYGEFLNVYSEKFEVNTIKRIQSFIPNLLHESGNFRYVKEILPKNKPNYLARIGNYFGRGLMQVTWLKNYILFTEWCKINLTNFKEDFSKNPELLETPKYAVLSAFWYWRVNRLNVYADREDFDNVCSLINRGKIIKSQDEIILINGYADRKKKYQLVNDYYKNFL